MLRKVLGICSVLSSFALLAQSKQVELSISPSTVEVGDPVTITVTSDVWGILNLDALPSEFSQYNAINTGSFQQMDHNTGKVITLYHFSTVGVMTKAGKFKMGPVYIKAGNKSYKSNSVYINVQKEIEMKSGVVTQQQMNDPAFGLLEANKTVIYEGEPVLVNAKIFSKYDPTHVTGYQSYDVPGTVQKNPIGTNNSLKKEFEKFKGMELYAFEYDKNVIFPTGVGDFKIEPFRLNLHQGYKSFPVASSNLVVNIKPLPANPPQDFIGGVGNFFIERSIDASGIKQGEVFQMTLIISGMGNLHNTLEPTLNLPKGYVVYGDPVITPNHAVGVHGVEGEIKYEYNIQVTRHGQLTLPETTISFFDPEKEEYIQVKSDVDSLYIRQNKQFTVANNASDETKDDELIIHQSNIRTNNKTSNSPKIYGTPLFWGGVSTPILAAFFFLFLARRREKSADVIKERQKTTEKGNKLKEQLNLAKSSISANDNSFYSYAEKALRMAFEIELKIEDRILSKNEIKLYLDSQNNTTLSNRVDHLFNTFEQSKYGFAPSSDSKQELYNELESVLKEVKRK